MEALCFFIPGVKIYPVMMSIQIYARGPEFFLLKWCNTARSERPKIRYYQPKNQLFPG